MSFNDAASGEYDVITAGGGIFSLCLATVLLRRGLRVLILEAGADVGAESANRSAGQSTPDLGGPASLISREIFDAWQEIYALPGHLRRRDTLHVALKGEPTTSYDNLYRRGGPRNPHIHELTPAEAESQWPGLLDAHKIQAVRLDNRDRGLVPSLLLADLRDYIINNGGIILPDSKVTGIRSLAEHGTPRYACTVQDGREYVGRSFVNAAGASANEVALLADTPIPRVHPARGGRFELELPAGLSLPWCAPMVVIDKAHDDPLIGAYYVPAGDELRTNRIFGADGGDYLIVPGNPRYAYDRILQAKDGLKKILHDDIVDMLYPALGSAPASISFNGCVRPLGPGLRGTALVGRAGRGKYYMTRSDHHGVQHGTMYAELLGRMIATDLNDGVAPPHHPKIERAFTRYEICDIDAFFDSYSFEKTGPTNGRNPRQLRYPDDFHPNNPLRRDEVRSTPYDDVRYEVKPEYLLHQLLTNPERSDDPSRDESSSATRIEDPFEYRQRVHSVFLSANDDRRLAERFISLLDQNAAAIRRRFNEIDEALGNETEPSRIPYQHNDNLIKGLIIHCISGDLPGSIPLLTWALTQLNDRDKVDVLREKIQFNRLRYRQIMKTIDAVAEVFPDIVKRLNREHADTVTKTRHLEKQNSILARIMVADNRYDRILYRNPEIGFEKWSARLGLNNPNDVEGIDVLSERRLLISAIGCYNVPKPVSPLASAVVERAFTQWREGGFQPNADASSGSWTWVDVAMAMESISDVYLQTADTPEEFNRRLEVATGHVHVPGKPLDTPVSEITQTEIVATYGAWREKHVLAGRDSLLAEARQSSRVREWPGLRVPDGCVVDVVTGPGVALYDELEELIADLRAFYVSPFALDDFHSDKDPGNLPRLRAQLRDYDHFVMKRVAHDLRRKQAREWRKDLIGPEYTYRFRDAGSRLGGPEACLLDGAEVIVTMRRGGKLALQLRESIASPAHRRLDSHQDLFSWYNRRQLAQDPEGESVRVRYLFVPSSSAASARRAVPLRGTAEDKPAEVLAMPIDLEPVIAHLRSIASTREVGRETLRDAVDRLMKPARSSQTTTVDLDGATVTIHRNNLVPAGAGRAYAQVVNVDAMEAITRVRVPSLEVEIPIPEGTDPVVWRQQWEVLAQESKAAASRPGAPDLNGYARLPVNVTAPEDSGRRVRLVHGHNPSTARRSRRST